MKPHFLICGGNTLSGEVTACGMKNAALPILFALLLVRGTVTLENLPPVTDIETTLQILTAMGATVKRLSPTSVQVNTDHTAPEAVPLPLTATLRGSSYLLGAGLARFGKISTGIPGGCNFGCRPLDQHFHLLQALGATIVQEDAVLHAFAPTGLRANGICLNFPSVGATVNGILAAVFAKGTTVIQNAAREPHVVDLANFLNACGADISGAGTQKIQIRGVRRLHGIHYSIVPDMIEAGTYLCAVCGTGGKLKLQKIVPDHLLSVISPLRKMGAEITISDSHLTMERTGKLYGTVLETQPYPGFPTDMQPQFAPLLCLSANGGRIYEHVWKNRFQYTNELKRMGATVLLNGDFADFAGKDQLCGTKIAATDLRGGAAMLIAGLCAGGKTELYEPQHLLRGYPDLLSKCAALGAEVSTVL